MKIKNISLIVFAITVMNIRLGKSRLFMKPNFWIMENCEDPKDAVLDLNPAVLGFDQDGWNPRSYQRWWDKRIYKTELKFWAVLGSRGCREKNSQLP